MRSALLTAGGMVLFALVGAGCREEPRLDAAITADVEREFAEEKIPGVIGVATIDGIVTLSGTVPNAAAKEDAEDAAEDVAGVKQVMNNLRTTAAGDAPASAPPIVDPNAPSAPSLR